MANLIYFYGPYIEYWLYIGSVWEQLGGNKKVNLSYDTTHNYLEYVQNKEKLPDAVVFLAENKCLGAALIAKPVSNGKVALIPFFDEYIGVDPAPAFETLEKLLGYFKEDPRFVFTDNFGSPVSPFSKSTGYQNQIRYDSIQKMLKKMVGRDVCIKQTRSPSKWSHRSKGSIDNKTANLIDAALGGKIKEHWNDPAVLGDILVEFLCGYYAEYADLIKADWEEFREVTFRKLGIS